MPFITVVPSIRTIPGVDAFDYRVSDGADFRVGDILLVPFRKQEIPALIVSTSDVSAFADRARSIESPEILLRGGSEAAELLSHAAHRAFVSRPTILNSWLREIPKRGRTAQTPPVVQSTFGGKLDRRYLIDRWHDPRGLVEEAKKHTGRVLILTPWQAWADTLGRELNAHVLHAGITPTAAWNAIRAFAGGTDGIIVATRIGAWLSLFADRILLDEPENDDYKQDELSPRLDARWIVAETTQLRPGLTLTAFGTTPRLGTVVDEWKTVPDINLPLSVESYRGHGKSDIDGLSTTALTKIEEAMNDDRPIIVLHPVRGERARITCHDCGWQATCPSCSFPVSLSGNMALCRRCGKKSPPPDTCPSCGGFDFSRGRAGTDRLHRQLEQISKDIVIVNTTTFYEMDLPPRSLVVVTDLSLIGGAVEDIRRRERLLLATRRIAAKVASVGGELHLSGSDDAVEEAQSWLTADGVRRTWDAERADRKTFGYPPIAWMAKVLVTGSDATAQSIYTELQSKLPEGMTLRGPFPVPFRTKSRAARQVIHVVLTGTATESALRKLLEPLAGRAIIDLDPIAFFA